MAKNFDAWWNEHYFYEKNGPLYRAFEKFDQLEGDLDYIDFLRKVLRWGDANLAKSPPDRARRRLESFVRSYDKELAENFQYIGLLAIEFTKRKMAERYLLDRDHLGLLSSRDIGEILIAVGKALSDIKNERFMVYNQSVVSTFAREADKNPLLYLLSDNGRVKRARGNQKDPWGSFFLLAVTEHMHEQKSRKFCYPEASLLLEKTRNPGGRSRPRKKHANSALVRVREFKKSYPDWGERLELVRDQFTRGNSAILGPPSASQKR